MFYLLMDNRKLLLRDYTNSAYFVKLSKFELVEINKRYINNLLQKHRSFYKPIAQLRIMIINLM